MSKAKTAAKAAKPAEQAEAAALAPVVPAPAEQVQEQPQVSSEAPAPVPALNSESPPVEPLDDFLRRIECAHIDRDVYAVAATHPEATERVWPGTYSGIRISQGDVTVTYSDGATA